MPKRIIIKLADIADLSGGCIRAGFCFKTSCDSFSYTCSYVQPQTPKNIYDGSGRQTLNTIIYACDVFVCVHVCTYTHMHAHAHINVYAHLCVACTLTDKCHTLPSIRTNKLKDSTRTGRGTGSGCIAPAACWKWLR